MTERRLLMTLDEARAAFAASALGLATSLACSHERLLRLLHGEGRTTGFTPEQRSAILEHRRLLNALVADGLDWIAEGELEGLASYLETESPVESAVAG